MALENHPARSPPPRWSRLLPLYGDLRGLDRGALAQDLLAGTITAILLIPQALAYALLAGLPPEVGLYASIVPPLVYALLGTSRTLAVGPVAVAAVMVTAALTPYAQGDPDKYLTGALILSALVGLLMLGLGLLRLGWLTAFISHPVLSGFTTGAAIFIVCTQLPALTGIAASRDAGLFELLAVLGRSLPELNPAAAAFGLATVAALLLARGPLLRALAGAGLARATAAVVVRTAPLVLVILAILCASALDAEQRWGLAIVGGVPGGLPRPRLDFLTAPGWLELLPSAALIALIAYVESISVAKALAFRRREKIDPDQELRALGVTNIAAACAGAMPVAGGFARSMVNFEAGARTQLAAIFTALWVALAALLFTGLLHDLPKAVLAAIIVVAVWQLIDLEGLRHTWRYDRGDGMAQAATLIGVLALGIELGLSIGVGLALLLFLYRTSRPHIAVVGRIPGTEHFRNIHRHVVETWPQLLLVRIDENLYFANTPRVESELQNLVVDRAGLKAVVLILSGVAYIDASALEMLENLDASLGEAGGELHLAEVKGPVLDQLRGSDLAERLHPARSHISTERAVETLTACA
ncbi:MAG: sodium-independent anion transporter [Porticoccaceae bacterium]|nr:sodium-independent anion transporter [Porticoccaceae bacterium]